MAKAFNKGETVRILASFSVADVLTDPTTVTLKLRTPAGVQTSHLYGTDPGVVKESVGLYHYDLPVSVSGKWVYRWEGTGDASAVEETHFRVLQSEFVEEA